MSASTRLAQHNNGALTTRRGFRTLHNTRQCRQRERVFKMSLFTQMLLATAARPHAPLAPSPPPAAHTQARRMGWKEGEMERVTRGWKSMTVYKA